MAERLGDPGSVRRALDLCCGTGAAFPYLQPLCSRGLAGVDFSLGMLAEARRKLRARPSCGPPVLLLQQDVLDLGVAGGFQLATCFGALGHVRRRDQPTFFRAVRSALDPGGRFALVTAPLPPPWSPRLWLAAAFDAGMWLRNRLWRPPFVMYYLALPLARARRLLQEAGFAVEELPLATPFQRARLLLARRPS